MNPIDTKFDNLQKAVYNYQSFFSKDNQLKDKPLEYLKQLGLLRSKLSWAYKELILNNEDLNKENYESELVKIVETHEGEVNSKVFKRILKSL